MRKAAANTMPDDGPEAGPRPKILLLEEDAVFAAHLKTGLTNLGCEVVLIRQGGEGLARAVSERFDLVIVSAELPGMNGFRVCNRIKKDPNVGSTPVFLMSSDASAISDHRSLATCADQYFDKPVSMDELSAQIQLRLSPRQSGDLSAALARTRDQLAALVELEMRLTEQERTIAELSAQLANARAAAAEAEARATAAVSVKHGSGEMAAVSTSQPLAGEPHGGDASAERRIARLEKQLAIAHADREHAGYRAKEAVRRTDKLKAELAEARAEWQLEREKLEKYAEAAVEAKAAVTAAISDERDRLTAECTALRARIATMQADLKRAREAADDRSPALDEAQATANRLRAELAQAKTDAQRAAEHARDELSRLRTQMTKELARELESVANEANRRANDEIAEIIARAGDFVRSIYTETERIEKDRDTRLAERDAEWQKRLEAALASRPPPRASAPPPSDRGAVQRDADARVAAAEARIRTLSAELAAERAAHEKTRAAHAADRAQLAERIAALDAQAASHADDLADVQREAEMGRAESAQLEAEIVVLRGELMSVRRQLDLKEATTRAATEQLERDRDIVERAKKLIDTPKKPGESA